MRGEFNGLKKLNCGENPFSFYIRWFVHQLQLALVVLSCSSIENFFEYVTLIVNTTSSPCKKNDLFLNKQCRILLRKLIMFFRKKGT